MSLNLTEQRSQAVADARRKHEQGDASGAKQVFDFVDKLELRMRPKPRFDQWPEDDESAEYRDSAEYRAWDQYIRTGKGSNWHGENRALKADDSTLGGSMVPPEQTTEQVLKAIDDALPIRQLATKITVSGAQSLGVPALDVDPDDGEWTVELSTGSEDTAMRFGKRELQPWPVIKRVRVTQKLLQRAKVAEPFVTGRIAYKLALTCEKVYLNGNGAQKPLGMFTASANGISTGRDVSGGNTTTSIGADGLINALYSLKEGYLRSPSLRWMFHRDAVKQTRLLKDSTGQYLWQPGMRDGAPDLILGVPVLMSEFAPNTFTTGLYAGIVGDFSYYWIADADTLSIQRLNELYIENSLIGFIGRFSTDGAPALEEAFARVKLA